LLKNFLKKLFYKLPFLEKFGLKIFLKLKIFPGSFEYWEQRYSKGRNSGLGSYGELALYKAEIINEFINKNNINSVIEFGCGDGNQLKLSNYKKYIGIDVSKTAILNCRTIFKKDSSKTFYLDSEFIGTKAELSLSLDVIYHLIEDDIFEKYMKDLFKYSTKYVLIYSSNFKSEQNWHVKHRNFNEWINNNIPNAIQKQFIKNRYPYKGDESTGSLADFYIYEIENII
tara:strand:+ start:24760 stop:25443 length:684 start_codon:yes stop_codon:yes gene_type:complete